MIAPARSPHAAGFMTTLEKRPAIRATIKRLALTVLTQDAVAGLITLLTRGAAAILTLHRFADPDLSVEGHSTEALRANLAHLRERGYQPAALPELLRGLEEGRPPRAGTVVFTVDDGYEDFARIAAPIFAEWDCPVHVFLTTGFLDRRLWLWWDRVQYLFDHTNRQCLTLALDNQPLAFRWSSHESRRAAATALSERLKSLPEQQKLAIIEQLAKRLEVVLPTHAPRRYAPMSWDSARYWSRRGVTFGPHSVSHPIMSRVDDRQARDEIVLSWKRVREEIPESLPAFCYPNGRLGDFTDREIALLRHAGLRAALTTEESYADLTTFSSTLPDQRFQIPRFAYPDDRRSFIKVVSGLERARDAVRGFISRTRYSLLLLLVPYYLLFDLWALVPSACNICSSGFIT